MRKLYLLSSILIAIFVLVGCGKKSNLPVISLDTSEVTIDISQPYDLMTGVTAVDKKKKDLTEGIQVDLGEYNPLYEGTYNITYTVTDSKGKVGTATRVINVVDQLRAKSAPTLSSPDTVVVEYKDLKITNQQLYRKLKELVGIQALIEMIDYELFKGYEVAADKIDEYYNNIVDYYGEAEFDKLMLQLGFYQGTNESTEAYDKRVKDYLSLYFLKVEAVKERVFAKLTDAEVNTAMTNYKEDLCVINLVYSTKPEAIDALKEISAYTGNKLDYFIANYESTDTTSDVTYLSQQLDCDYDRIVYNKQSNATYRDYLYNELTVGEYTIEAVANNSKYYLSYVVGQASPKEQYDQELFEEEIREELVNAKLTQEYITSEVKAIRLEKGLKIYDPLLASQYKLTDNTFTGVSELTDSSILASFNNKNITTDEFYATLKSRYGAPELLNKINFYALKDIEGIQLSEDDLIKINVQVDSIKSQYETYYSTSGKFIDFLIYNFGVVSEDELVELLKGDLLSKRYLLGYNTYTGQDPILTSDIDEAYAEYFNVKASHILFTFNSDETKQVALLKANQVINGVQAGETAHILLDGQNFVGLESLKNNPDQLLEAFGKLASEFSADTGSGARLGDLGYFTPGQMVKPFEDATRELAKIGVGAFSDTPVESEFGYHVILITDVKTPVKPSNYDSLTTEQINEIVKAKTDTAFISYHNVITKIKSSLEAERLTYDNINEQLKTLRISSDITFNDAQLEEHYEKLNN